VRAHRPYRPVASRPSTGKAGVARRRVRTGHRVRSAGEWANCVYRPECQIVSAELWERANAMARVTAATSPRSSKEPRLLKGLVYHEAPHGPLARHLMHAHAGKKRRARYAYTHRAGSGAKACWYAVCAEPLEEADWTLMRDLALLARAESLPEEGDAAGALRRVVRATLGVVTVAELDALNLEGRRQRVRQVVERVEVGPFGARVRLRLGGRLVPLANETIPACPAGRRRAGGGAAGRSGAGRAPAPWRSSGRC
jgi:hypothetical protein